MTPRYTHRLQDRLGRMGPTNLRIEYNLEKPPLRGRPLPDMDFHEWAELQSAHRRTTAAWIPVIVIALLVLMAVVLMLSPVVQLWQRAYGPMLP